MIMAGDFRKGMTLEIDGKVYVIVDFQHVKPGKGAAFVRAKIKNVMTGQVLESTYNPSDKYPSAHIERKELEYCYNDGELYYFMDAEAGELIPFNRDIVEDALPFIIEGTTVTVQSYKDKPFSVIAPNFVELTIVECEPGVQGDTSKAGNKPARLETGLQVQVPLFVNNGERIRIDTRDGGTYMERVK